MRRLFLMLALGPLFAACAPDSGSDADTDSDTDVDADTDSDTDTGPGEFRLLHEFPAVAEPGAAYEHVFRAEGGTPPYDNWHVRKGELADWMSLDAGSGTLSGTPADEGFSYFVLCAEDAESAEACEMYGVRSGAPGTVGSLATRAEGYQQTYEARHYTHGIAFNARTPDDPGGHYGYTTRGDAAFQSGQCTQAMALRHAVLDTPETLDLIRRHLQGWRDFQRITGVKGLIGRSFYRDDWPMEPGAFDYEGHGHLFQGTGDFVGWTWQADTSRDQVSGAVNGVAMAFDAVDDEQVKNDAREFLVDLADHVWDNGLKIIDVDGEVTEHGEMDGEIWEGAPFPNGMNAVCTLAWLKAAHHASGEPRFEEYYRELVYERDYVSILRDHQWVYMGYGTTWYNVFLVYQNWFHLMRLERDPVLREQYHAIFRDTMWLNTAGKRTPNRKAIAEGNPLKIAWYLYSTGERDPERLHDALWQVVVFGEPPLRDRRVENSSDPEIEKNPDKLDESLYPLPSNLRKPDMVIWHRNPFELDGGSDSGEERTGCDYLLPYWLGRYYGYIGADW